MTLALDLLRAVDPVALAREVGMTPDLWQADALRDPTDRLLLNCCRQAGKSTVAALLAVHTAVYELEAAPPAPPLLKDDFARLYRVVGAAALVVRG